MTEAILRQFKNQFEKSVQAWVNIFEDGRIGTEYAQLSEDEITVFQIDKSRWPHMVALFEAYEALTDICDMGNYDDALCLAMREQYEWLKPRSMEQAAFQELGQLVDVTYREARAMYWKVCFWEQRAGLVRFKDETDFKGDDIPS